MEKIIHDFTTEIRLTGDEAKEICRLGRGDECCAFLVCGADGFECVRMSRPSLIFRRIKEGTMNAKGQGEWEGCPCSAAAREDE